MTPIRTLLIIEDNPGDALLLREMFKDDGSHSAELTHVSDMNEAENCLNGNVFDIILLDLGLPDAQGLEAITRAHAAAPNLPLVVLTGLDDEALGAQTLRAGAQDYLIKGQIEPKGLLRTLRYAIERKRLERLKEEFVATVSHELRTPLTSISASLGLLELKAAGMLTAPAARLLTIAYSNSQRLVRLVDDILDIEKLEAGRVVFDFKRVDVRMLVENAIEANRGYAQSHAVRISLTGLTGNCGVRADADRLVQVVTNLLSNSIKFSPENNEVVVSIEEGAGSIRISVRDHGIGISPDFRANLFDKFAQADATNARQKGGTGLGLSIVKQIVERLGGEVGFADAPGGGAIFFVELPTWETAIGHGIDLKFGPGLPLVGNGAGIVPALGSLIERVAAMSSEGDSLPGMIDTPIVVLLVEDSIGDVRLTQEAFQQAGHMITLHVASDGAEAMRFLRREGSYASAPRPDLILLDLNLPKMDGREVLAQIKQDEGLKLIPTVILTTSEDQTDIVKSYKLHANGYLTKPVQLVGFEILIKSIADFWTKAKTAQLEHTA